MNIQHKISALFRKWLESEEALRYIRGCAAKILKNPDACGLPGLDLSSSHENGRAPHNDVAQELVTFILESYLPDAASRVERLNLLVQGKFQTFVSCAAARFALDMQDKSRGRDADPVKYLYRRFRQILSDSSRFDTGPLPDKGMWYAVRGNDAGCRPARGRQTPEADPPDYSLWGFPDRIFSGRAEIEKLLFKRETLVEIAVFFWETAQRHGLGQRLPIRELVNYTALKFPWLNRPGMVSLDLDDREEKAGQTSSLAPGRLRDEASASPEELADLAMSVQSISVMAMTFAASCTAEECRVFLLRAEDPPVKFGKIAKMLDLKDHNRANTIFQRFKKKLKNFMSAWPGPGLDELPEDASFIFMEALKIWCKKGLQGRKQ